MSDYLHNTPYVDDRPGVDAGRLWAGGIATAVVAALLAVVGLLIARGLFGVAVLAPRGEGIWGDATTSTYAIIAALVAIAATGLMHVLCLATPTPGQFFGWIMVLVTLIAVVIPLTLDVQLSTKIATGLINLILGLAIASIISNMATSARAIYQRKHAEQVASSRYHQARYERQDRYPDTRQWDR
ncbi:MAG TPA: DUF6069 family protein [Pseudonocardiaceae bacterium]|jgi:hypothetical protein|nr:DUF6069 family protein [Pseudonocardiaceae bacterium]